MFLADVEPGRTAEPLLISFTTQIFRLLPRRSWKYQSGFNLSPVKIVKSRFSSVSIAGRFGFFCNSWGRSEAGVTIGQPSAVQVTGSRDMSAQNSTTRRRAFVCCTSTQITYVPFRRFESQLACRVRVGTYWSVTNPSRFIIGL